MNKYIIPTCIVDTQNKTYVEKLICNIKRNNIPLGKNCIQWIRKSNVGENEYRLCTLYFDTHSFSNTDELFEIINKTMRKALLNIFGDDAFQYANVKMKNGVSLNDAWTNDCTIFTNNCYYYDGDKVIEYKYGDKISVQNAKLNILEPHINGKFSLHNNDIYNFELSNNPSYVLKVNDLKSPYTYLYDKLSKDPYSLNIEFSDDSVKITDNKSIWIIGKINYDQIYGTNVIDKYPSNFKQVTNNTYISTKTPKENEFSLSNNINMIISDRAIDLKYDEETVTSFKVDSKAIFLEKSLFYFYKLNDEIFGLPFYIAPGEEHSQDEEFKVYRNVQNYDGVFSKDLTLFMNINKKGLERSEVTGEARGEATTNEELGEELVEEHTANSKVLQVPIYIMKEFDSITTYMMIEGRFENEYGESFTYNTPEVSNPYKHFPPVKFSQSFIELDINDSIFGKPIYCEDYDYNSPDYFDSDWKIKTIGDNQYLLFKDSKLFYVHDNEVTDLLYDEEHIIIDIYYFDKVYILFKNCGIGILENNNVKIYHDPISSEKLLNVYNNIAVFNNYVYNFNTCSPMNIFDDIRDSFNNYIITNDYNIINLNGEEVLKITNEKYSYYSHYIYFDNTLYDLENSITYNLSLNGSFVIYSNYIFYYDENEIIIKDFNDEIIDQCEFSGKLLYVTIHKYPTFVFKNDNETIILTYVDGVFESTSGEDIIIDSLNSYRIIDNGYSVFLDTDFSPIPLRKFRKSAFRIKDKYYLSAPWLDGQTQKYMYIIDYNYSYNDNYIIGTAYDYYDRIFKTGEINNSKDYDKDNMKDNVKDKSSNGPTYISSNNSLHNTSNNLSNNTSNNTSFNTTFKQIDTIQSVKMKGDNLSYNLKNALMINNRTIKSISLNNNELIYLFGDIINIHFIKIHENSMDIIGYNTKLEQYIITVSITIDKFSKGIYDKWYEVHNMLPLQGISYRGRFMFSINRFPHKIQTDDLDIDIKSYDPIHIDTKPLCANYEISVDRDPKIVYIDMSTIKIDFRINDSENDIGSLSSYEKVLFNYELNKENNNTKYYSTIYFKTNNMVEELKSLIDEGIYYLIKCGDNMYKNGDRIFELHNDYGDKINLLQFTDEIIKREPQEISKTNNQQYLGFKYDGVQIYNNKLYYVYKNGLKYVGSLWKNSILYNESNDDTIEINYDYTFTRSDKELYGTYHLINEYIDGTYEKSDEMFNGEWTYQTQFNYSDYDLGKNELRNGYVYVHDHNYMMKDSFDNSYKLNVKYMYEKNDSIIAFDEYKGETIDDPNDYYIVNQLSETKMKFKDLSQELYYNDFKIPLSKIEPLKINTGLNYEYIFDKCIENKLLKVYRAKLCECEGDDFFDYIGVDENDNHYRIYDQYEFRMKQDDKSKYYIKDDLMISQSMKIDNYTYYLKRFPTIDGEFIYDSLKNIWYHTCKKYGTIYSEDLKDWTTLDNNYYNYHLNTSNGLILISITGVKCIVNGLMFTLNKNRDTHKILNIDEHRILIDDEVIELSTGNINELSTGDTIGYLSINYDRIIITYSDHILIVDKNNYEEICDIKCSNALYSDLKNINTLFIVYYEENSNYLLYKHVDIIRQDEIVGKFDKNLLIQDINNRIVKDINNDIYLMNYERLTKICSSDSNIIINTDSVTVIENDNLSIYMLNGKVINTTIETKDKINNVFVGDHNFFATDSSHIYLNENIYKSDYKYLINESNINQHMFYYNSMVYILTKDILYTFNPTTEEFDNRNISHLKLSDSSQMIDFINMGYAMVYKTSDYIFIMTKDGKCYSDYLVRNKVKNCVVHDFTLYNNYLIVVYKTGNISYLYTYNYVTMNITLLLTNTTDIKLFRKPRSSTFYFYTNNNIYESHLTSSVKLIKENIFNSSTNILICDTREIKNTEYVVIDDQMNCVRFNDKFEMINSVSLDNSLDYDSVKIINDVIYNVNNSFYIQQFNYSNASYFQTNYTFTKLNYNGKNIVALTDDNKCVTIVENNIEVSPDNTTDIIKFDNYTLFMTSNGLCKYNENTKKISGEYKNNEVAEDIETYDSDAEDKLLYYYPSLPYMNEMMSEMNDSEEANGGEMKGGEMKDNEIKSLHLQKIYSLYTSKDHFIDIIVDANIHESVVNWSFKFDTKLNLNLNNISTTIDQSYEGVWNLSQYTYLANDVMSCSVKIEDMKKIYINDLHIEFIPFNYMQDNYYIDAIINVNTNYCRYEFQDENYIMIHKIGDNVIFNNEIPVNIFCDSNNEIDGDYYIDDDHVEISSDKELKIKSIVYCYKDNSPCGFIINMNDKFKFKMIQEIKTGYIKTNSLISETYMKSIIDRIKLSGFAICDYLMLNHVYSKDQLNNDYLIGDNKLIILNLPKFMDNNVIRMHRNESINSYLNLSLGINHDTQLEPCAEKITLNGTIVSNYYIKAKDNLFIFTPVNDQMILYGDKYIDSFKFSVKENLNSCAGTFEYGTANATFDLSEATRIETNKINISKNKNLSEDPYFNALLNSDFIKHDDTTITFPYEIYPCLYKLDRTSKYYTVFNDDLKNKDLSFVNNYYTLNNVKIINSEYIDQIPNDYEKIPLDDNMFSKVLSTLDDVTDYKLVKTSLIKSRLYSEKLLLTSHIDSNKFDTSFRYLMKDKDDSEDCNIVLSAGIINDNQKYENMIKISSTNLDGNVEVPLGINLGTNQSVYISLISKSSNYSFVDSTIDVKSYEYESNA